MTFEKLTILFFLVFSAIALHGQDQTFNTNLPIVFLNTGGNAIVDDPRIVAQMGIAWNENGETNTSDPQDHFNGKIKIEIRGSSSQMFEKKSFAFELKDEMDEDMDFPLLGMPEEEDWILYAPFSDKTLIRNVLTYTLASQISDVYAPRCRFVELFLNEKYEGVYVLMENIKRDSVRVDIAKLKVNDIEGEDLTGGYIVKVDKKTGGSGEGWYSKINNSRGARTYYQYEYPGAADIQVQQKEYIQNYIDDFESAIYNEDFHPETGYSSYINPASFFDYIFLNEISKNVDGYRLSTFLYKDKNDKLNAGPLWDFNLGYGNANYYNGWETHNLQLYANLGDDNWQNPFWWKSMMSDPQFTHPLKCRWDSLRENSLSDGRIIEVCDSLVNLLTTASERNFDRWQILDQWVWPNYFVGSSYWQEVNWLKDWITERLRWLDFAMPGDCGSEPGMPPPDFAFDIYPNPFTSKFTIQIQSDANLMYKIQLFTVNGQMVHDLNLQVVEGPNSFDINTGNLQSGVFIYRLTKGYSEVSVGKIVKVQ
jgi:hypothetical protein